MHGHHWPVLRPGHMVCPKSVPQNYVRVFYLSVQCGPGWQPCTTWMLVWIIPGREAFAWIIGCDPEVLAGKGCPPQSREALVGKRQHVFAGDQLVANRVAETIAHCRVNNLPVARREWIDDLLPLGFGCQ